MICLLKIMGTSSTALFHRLAICPSSGGRSSWALGAFLRLLLYFETFFRPGIHFSEFRLFNLAGGISGHIIENDPSGPFVTRKIQAEIINLFRGK